MTVPNPVLSIRPAVAAGVLLLGVLLSPSLSAAVWSSSTGGAMCKGSSGTSAPLLYFANTYVQNTSGGGAYVTCGFTDVHSGTTAAAEEMWIGLSNPTAAAITFTCAVQTGYPAMTTSIHTVSFNRTVPAHTDDFVVLNASSTPSLPGKLGPHSPYSLTCLVPSQGKVGLLSLIMGGTV